MANTRPILCPTTDVINSANGLWFQVLRHYMVPHLCEWPWSLLHRRIWWS